VLAAPRFVLFFRYVILSGSHNFKTVGRCRVDATVEKELSGGGTEENRGFRRYHRRPHSFGKEVPLEPLERLWHRDGSPGRA